MFSESFIGGLLLLIVCATFAILFLIDGVIGQLIHTVVNFKFIFNREERGYAICAFIIALLSIVITTPKNKSSYRNILMQWWW